MAARMRSTASPRWRLAQVAQRPDVAPPWSRSWLRSWSRSSMWSAAPSFAATLLAATLLAACGGSQGDAAAPPPPQALTADAVGHYCGMNLDEHIGPKGQILLRDRALPVWFSTIREVFAYTLLPEEPKTILAIYVQDMGQADSSGNPPSDAWISARDAYFVIEGRAVGGMGAPDALPFTHRDDALAFTERHGGRIVTFQEMPEDYPLRAGTLTPTRAGASSADSSSVGSSSEATP